MLTAIVFFAFLGWVYLALFNGAFWEPLLDKKAPTLLHWPDVDIIVPARNEAEALPIALPSLLAQNYPGKWRILLVDDHSTDGTGDLARRLAAESGHDEKLKVIQAPDLPPGWGGKLAAMQAGIRESSGSFVLFTDSDIRHHPSSLRDLVARADAGGYDLTSLMVRLNCTSWVEKLMIPAFVYFFAMLYPFQRANNASSKVAGAAGGVMLVRRSALDLSGGLEKIKGTVIDDCSLARQIKDNGGKLCLTLTNDVTSLRTYPKLRDVHDMVARTAFTQLRHSYLLVAGSVIGLGLLFWMPLFGLLFPPTGAFGFGLWALVVMFLTYKPMVRFYGLSAYWAASLPFAAFFYIVATIDSARQYALGRGGLWKGRTSAI